MTLLRINALADRPVLADRPQGRLLRELAPLLASLPDGSPIVVMIHGYRFSPWHPDHDPHGHILSLSPRTGCWKAVSWPRKLGFGPAPQTGLAIAFGWEARLGGLRTCYDRAAEAGRALAVLLDVIQDLAPRRSVDLIAHSLGARVALSSQPHLQQARPDRALLLAPAEYAGRAAQALAAPAGRDLSVLQVAPGENRAFDLGFQALVPRPRAGDRALGLAPIHDPNWVVLNPACAATRAHLARHGHRLGATARPVCHWSSYRRPGLFPLYRMVIRDKAGWPLSRLRTAPVRATPAAGGLPNPAHGL